MHDNWTTEEHEYDEFSVYEIARDSILGFEPIHVQEGFVGDRYHYSCEYEILIDGKRLTEMPGMEFVHGSLYPFFSSDVNRGSFNELLLLAPSENPDGRVCLLCQPGGDVREGGVTVRITETSEYFIWHDIWFENGCDPGGEALGIGPFRFAKDQYIAAIRAAIPREAV